MIGVPNRGTKALACARARAIKKALALFLLLTIATIVSNKIALVVDAKLSCSSTQECERGLQVGSKCVDGFCSNPFQEGCLKTMLGSLGEAELAEKNLAPEVLGALNGRVCNSDDGTKTDARDVVDKNENDDGKSSSFCIANEFDYFEIRIHNANWESSIFVSWIMQIMLMEVLKVPVTIGVKSGLTNISSFYSPVNTLEYSNEPYPWDALTHSVDCDTTDEHCIHVMPEVWNGQESKWISMMEDGIIEPVDGCGQVGKLGWFVPGSTAKRDDSLVSYYGLQGERNRAKLAQAFKRPTTWLEYCEEVSIDNCTTPDETAKHYPETQAEAGKYFQEGEFQGYFRMLPENNCEEFPKTCTGYIVGPICTWSTNVEAQLYWNDIVGLNPDGPSKANKGYEYYSQIEIWRAANATKSDVMMWWWQPEALVEEFSSTDYSFQQIILPTVTDVCSEKRIGVEDRCVDDIAVRRGDPLGACDYEAHALQKVISINLQKKTMEAAESSRSPGYPFIRSLKVSDLEIQALLKKWMAIQNDQYGNDARVAVCSWVVDHMDTLLHFIPPGHPRNLDPTGSFNQGYLYVAMALAVFSFLVLLAIAGFVHQYRLTKVFVYAQEIFIQIILVGFLLVIAGGFLYAMEPTNFTCVARNWLTNLGFSAVLGVVLVKMSTTNRIMQSSKRLKRVKVSIKSMLVSLGFLVMIDLIFLIAWTVVSPPKAVKELDLPEEFSTTVKVSLICRSDQIIWPYVSEIWHTLLLIVASVLAFQSRDIIPDFNESRSIGTMIYSHFLFIVFRLIVFLLGVQGAIATDVFGASISFLYLFDTMFATTIYVVPKCVEARKHSSVYTARGSSLVNPPQSFKNARRSTRNVTPDLNIDHGRQPFGLRGLQAVSMEVNYTSESTMISNLRGRQPRRRTSFSTNGASSNEPSTSLRNDSSIHEDDWNRRSILSSKEESIIEESQYDLNDEESASGPAKIGNNETKASKNLSSHDATTVSDNGGVMAEPKAQELTSTTQSNTDQGSENIDSKN